MYRKRPLVFFFQAFVCLSKCCLFQNDGCQTQPGHNNQVTTPSTFGSLTHFHMFWIFSRCILREWTVHPHIAHMCVRTECSQAESRQTPRDPHTDTPLEHSSRVWKETPVRKAQADLGQEQIIFQRFKCPSERVRFTDSCKWVWVYSDQ